MGNEEKRCLLKPKAEELVQENMQPAETVPVRAGKTESLFKASLEDREQGNMWLEMGCCKTARIEELEKENRLLRRHYFMMEKQLRDELEALKLDTNISKSESSQNSSSPQECDQQHVHISGSSWWRLKFVRLVYLHKAQAST